MAKSVACVTPFAFGVRAVGTIVFLVGAIELHKVKISSGVRVKTRTPEIVARRIEEKLGGGRHCTN